MSATDTTQANAERVIVDAILSFGPATGVVTRSDTFDTLDIDSLDLVELAQLIEDEFAVKLDTEDVAKLSCVGDLVDLVASRAA